MGPAEPREPRSALEATWRDNIARERRLLRDHPEWNIKRITPANGPTTDDPTTFEATDGVVTIRTEDLGALLDLVERAMQEGN